MADQSADGLLSTPERVDDAVPTTPANAAHASPENFQVAWRLNLLSVEHTKGPRKRTAEKRGAEGEVKRKRWA